MQDNQTINADTHLIFQFAEKGQLYNLTKDIVQKELSLPCAFIKQFEQQSNNQVSQTKQFLCQLTDIIQNPFNILIKQKIKSLLIDLFQAGETIPEILLFIQLTKNMVCLQKHYQFEQQLQNKFKTLQRFERIDESYIQIFQQSDELIIQITLNVLHEAIKNEQHFQMNLDSQLEIFEQIKFVNKDDFSLHGKQILNLLNKVQKQLFEKEYNQSKFIPHQQFQLFQITKPNKILNTHSFRNENQSKNQLDSQKSKVEEEKAKQYILKFFILILVEKEIILPNLIKLIRFRERRRKISSRRALENRYVELMISPSVLLQISLLQQIKEIIFKLQIDPSDTNQQKQNYYIIKTEVEQNYPQFVQIGFLQSIIMALELIYQKAEENYEQLQEVFQDQHVQELMRKIEKMYGSKFIEIENQKQNIDNIFKAQEHTRMIEIGYILRKIYQKIILIEQQINFYIQNEKKIFQKFTPERVVNGEKLFANNQKPEKEKKSIYNKQEISYAIINKIFFQFITKLTEYGIPYPFFIQILKLSETRILIRYPIEYVRKLTLKKRFVMFVKEEYNLEMTQDKHVNVENLKKIDKQKYRRKEGCFWYPIIQQQCQIIYDYRELLECKLKKIAKLSNYQELIKFCAYEYETNQQHQLLQKALRKLIDYINSLYN